MHAGIILGAGDFDYEKLECGKAFHNAYRSLRDYVAGSNGLNISGDLLLDLFNHETSASEQVDQIDNFVLGLAEKDISLLFLFYIGHGHFRSKDNYYWAVRATRDANVYNSSIDVRNLGVSLKKIQSNCPIVCVADCCFSAATAPSMQNIDGLQAEAAIQARDAFQVPKGTVVVSSTGSETYSYISRKEEITFFGRAFREVLQPREDLENDELLSPLDLGERIAEWMKHDDADWATTPEVHAPRQDVGQLISHPIFPVVRRSGLTADAGPNVIDPLPIELQEAAPVFLPSDEEKVKIRNVFYCAERFSADLVSEIDKSELKNLLYAHYFRTKSVKDISEKMRRKREGQYERGEEVSYRVDDVTDVLGFRLITLFRDDVEKVLHQLCRLITGDDSKMPLRIFDTETTVHETIAYYSNTFPNAVSYADESADILNSYFNRPPHNCIAKLVVKEEYSSVHVVIKTCRMGGDGMDERIIVPIEFQIRTVFEDTWAQVDHKLRYRKTRNSAGENGDNGSVSYVEERENIPPIAEKLLKLLKRNLDGAGDLAETVRVEVEPPIETYAKATRAMDNAEDFVDAVRNLGGHPGDFEEFYRLLGRKDQIDKKYQAYLDDKVSSNPKEITEVRKHYGVLAEDISGLFDRVKKGINLLSGSEAQKYFFYSLRMEEAYCRFFSAPPGVKDEIVEARQIYESLLPLYEDYPALHYRMAQANQTLGRIGRAIESMRKAENAMAKVPDDAEFDLRLIGTQKTTLDQNLKRILGYYHWARAERTRKGEDYSPVNDQENVRQDYVAAVTHTLEGIERCSDRDLLRDYNNIVAYFNDLIRLNDGGFGESYKKGAPSQNEFESYFLEYKNRFKEGDEYVVRLETVATAYKRLGLIAEAKKYAHRIQKSIRENELFKRGELDRDTLQEINDIAYDIIQMEEFDD